jgi:hypothetical protein
VTQAVLKRPTDSRTAFSRAVEIGTTRVLFALRRHATQHDQLPRPIDIAEPDREHLTLAHPGVQGGDDHRAEKRRRDCQQLRLFVLPQSPAALVVFVLFPDQRLRSAPERRPFEVLAADRPVHHVPQQFDRPVDRCRRQRAIRLSVHNSRQLEVGDEILDVGGLDVLQRAIAESVDQWLER